MSIKATVSYNLQVNNPNLALEWHPTKNGELIPQNVTPKSKQKVWWRCKKGHEWQAVVGSRTQGSGCPFCAHKCLNDENCLLAINPTLSLQWNHSRNGNLTPKDVFANTRKKVWWRCKKGHEWLASVNNRNYDKGCPYCSGHLTAEERCLQTTNPALAREWHPTRNRDLSAVHVSPSSNKKVWWLCSKGHEWKARIAHRTNGSGCPYCANRRVNMGNCLSFVNPTLAREWHPNLNGDLTPRDVTPGAGKKVWWLCKKGHEWQATIDNRSKGKGCPSCNPKTSSLELRIFTELKNLFPKVVHREKICGKECDIYIPSIRIGIEIDGYYWHKDSYSKDRNKTKFFRSKDIYIVRLREKGLRRVADTDIFYSPKEIKFDLIARIVALIHKIGEIDQKTHETIENYLNKRIFVNDKEYMSMLSMLSSALPGTSLFDLNKKITQEWNLTKNGNLSPKDVTLGSNIKAWWRCRKGHEWKAAIFTRAKGAGCPYCSNKLVNHENCLETVNPTLASEWHPTKNGDLTPQDVTPGSNMIVWWICSNSHEWQAMINRRNRGTSCPYCRDRKTIRL